MVKNWQGTRRVYFKDNFYESVFTYLPSRVWAVLYGTNTWAWSNIHPVTAVAHEPWDSNFHQGNHMEVPLAANWHSCIATQTAFKFDNTAQPYVDPSTGDGSSEPVIYEFKWWKTHASEIIFCFMYDSATNVGLGIRGRLTGGAGTDVIELVSVTNGGSPPAINIINQWPVSPQFGDWRYFRVYYAPSDIKFGGKTITNAGTIEIFISDGNANEMPNHYMEGIPVVSGTQFTQRLSGFTIPPGATRRTTGDSLAWIVGPNCAGFVGGIKYCRHWDYGIQSIAYRNAISIKPGVLDMTLALPIDESYHTDEDGQIGYEIGDRIECQTKTRFKDYASPPNEYERNSVITFDGFINDVQQKGGAGGGNASDIQAMDYYGQLVKDVQHHTFGAGSTLKAAFLSMGPIVTYAYPASPMNAYGLDPALAGLTFIGAKNFKGLSSADVIRWLLLFSNSWSFWHPDGTWVVSTDFPQDAGYIIDPFDATYQYYIVHWEEVESGDSMINNVDVYSPGAATQTRNDAAFHERYMKRSGALILSRETNVADMQTYGDNLVNAWKRKRRIIEVYACAFADILPGDIVTLSIPQLKIDTDLYQVIETKMNWGDRFGARSNIMIFRLVEYVDANTPPIWFNGFRNKLGATFRTAREALGQHA